VVSFIKDQEEIHLNGEARQITDFLFPQDPAGRVAGAGDENDLGPWADAFLQGLEIDMKILGKGDEDRSPAEK
jgi:hypothetical protein